MEDHHADNHCSIRFRWQSRSLATVPGQPSPTGHRPISSSPFVKSTRVTECLRLRGHDGIVYADPNIPVTPPTAEIVLMAPPGPPRASVPRLAAGAHKYAVRSRRAPPPRMGGKRLAGEATPKPFATPRRGGVWTTRARTRTWVLCPLQILRASVGSSLERAAVLCPSA